MRRILPYLLLVLPYGVKAQQDALSAQYINTPMQINPAYAGSTRDLNISANYRKQWAGFSGSPTTFGTLAHVAFSKNTMGAGLILQQDKVAANSSTDVQGVYAYHLPVMKETTLSFGMQFGMINYRTDYSELVINPNDPGFTSTSEWQANFGAGVILTNDKYFVSIASLKMLDPSAQLARQGLYRRNLYIMTAYTFQFTSRLRLKPYALYRGASGSKYSYDLGANLLGDDSYAIGAFTRAFHTYGLSAQLKLGELLRVGYVFELPTARSAGANFTSHEIQVIVRMGVLNAHDIGGVRNF